MADLLIPKNESAPYCEVNGDMKSQEILRKTHSKSKMKKKLIDSLAYFNEHPLLFLCCQFMIGFFFISIPMSFLLLKFILNNYILYTIPLLVSVIVQILIISFLIIKKFCNSRKKITNIKYSWERNNGLSLLSFFGKSVLILSIIIMLTLFFQKIHFLRDKIHLILEEEEEKCHPIKGSFFYRIIFYFSFIRKEEFSANSNTVLCFEFTEYTEESIHQILYHQLMILSIPLFILFFFRALKFTLIKDRNYNEKLIFSLLVITEGLMFFIFEKISFIDYSLINNIQVITMFGISFSYGIAKSKEAVDLFMKKREMEFGITKLPNIYIYFKMVNIFLLTVEILFVSLLCGFFLISDDNTLNIKFFFLGLSCIYLSISFHFSVIFGHFFFHLLYYPLAFQFCPGLLKNHFYIRVEKAKTSYNHNKNRKSIFRNF